MMMKHNEHEQDSFFVGGNEVDEQTSNARLTMNHHEQEKDSLSDPRPPIHVDERTPQKRCTCITTCITADEARAVFVGGNEVDERTSISKSTGQRRQPRRKAKTVHIKTDAQPKMMKRRKLDFLTTSSETARPIGFDLRTRYIPKRLSNSADRLRAGAVAGPYLKELSHSKGLLNANQKELKRCTKMCRDLILINAAPEQFRIPDSIWMNVSGQ